MALERLIDGEAATFQPDDLYLEVNFPEPPPERPYVFINMVSTVDGKIVVGNPGGTAKGVGGPTDQKLFRRLQSVCDAAILGSATLRAGTVLYASQIARFVVTRTGDLPFANRFFTDAPDRAFVIAPRNMPRLRMAEVTRHANLIQTGDDDVDLKEAFRILRSQHQIRYLLCEGGANLNDQLLRAGLADELFLTLTSKLKGGAQLPTIVEGVGFPPNDYLVLKLLSLYRDGDELYLRYRIAPTPQHT